MQLRRLLSTAPAPAPAAAASSRFSKGAGSKLNSTFLKKLQDKDQARDIADTSSGVRPRTAKEKQMDTSRELRLKRIADARALVFALARAEKWDLSAMQAHVRASLETAAAKEEEEERFKNSSWRSMLFPTKLGAKPSMSRMQLEQIEKIFTVFTPEEMTTDKIDQRFADTVLRRVRDQKNRKVVRDLMQQMSANSMIHKYVRSRVTKGLPIPDDIKHIELALVNQSGRVPPRIGGALTIERMLEKKKRAKKEDAWLPAKPVSRAERAAKSAAEAAKAAKFAEKAQAADKAKVAKTLLNQSPPQSLPQQSPTEEKNL